MLFFHVIVVVKVGNNFGNDYVAKASSGPITIVTQTSFGQTTIVTQASSRPITLVVQASFGPTTTIAQTHFGSTIIIAQAFLKLTSVVTQVGGDILMLFIPLGVGIFFFLACAHIFCFSLDGLTHVVGGVG